MEGWRATRIGELGKVVTGKTPPANISDVFGGSIPFITPRDMLGSRFIDVTERYLTEKGGGILSRYFLPKNSILVSCIGSDMGKVAISKNESVTNQQLNAIVVKEEISWLYIYYNLLPRKQELKSIAGGSAQPILNKSSFSNIEILLPGFIEQQAIAHILGTLDDKIELNRRQNATLEAMAQAIFKDWFVDFGPVRAKMEGRQPEGMSREIADLFPDRLDDEGKPEGWKWGTLGEYAQLNPESWSKKKYPDKIYYVDLSNTKWGTIESISHYDKEKAPSRAQRVLRIGDTIIGTVRPGNGSFAYIGCNGLTGSTGFAVLRPRKETYKEFIYCAATDKYNIDRISFLADGGAYPAVKPEIILDTQVCICIESVMKEFSMLLSALMKKIEENKKQNLNLALIRDNLLPKLISGELRVPDAEKMVADIV